MAIDLAALPDDVDTLHRKIGELATAIDSERGRAQTEIERLQQIVKVLQLSRFGRRSEHLGDDQLQPGPEDLDADIARGRGRYTSLARQSPGVEPSSFERAGLPNHLPRTEMTVDIAPGVCPCCGGAVHEIGETVSEMLDYVSARLRVLRIRHPKMRLPDTRDDPLDARTPSTRVYRRPVGPTPGNPGPQGGVGTYFRLS